MLAGLTAGTVAVTALSLMVGSRYVPLSDVFAVLGGAGSPEARAVISDFRMPRTLSGLAGGSALAVAGVIMQAHTRNRLADPGLMGVSAGAAVAMISLLHNAGGFGLVIGVNATIALIMFLCTLALAMLIVSIENRHAAAQPAE